MEGNVAIVGAGPGDPGLITEKGKTLLEKADVIVYDRLVHPLLLEHTKEEAERIYCGKIPRGKAVRQSRIQEMLMDYAHQGKRVVRLKGGDPGVFAHLGEEAEELSHAGVSYEIVPGLTAGLAGAAYAGIPATYRSLSTSVAFVTGHCRKNVPLSEVVIPQADTLIFYMGMHNLPYWMERLIAEGWDPAGSVAVVQWGTTPKQRVINGQIQSIANDVDEKGITNPALVIVGETAKMHLHLQWFEQLPLQGTSMMWASNGQEGAKNEMKRLGAHVFSYPKENVTIRPPKLPLALTAYQRVHFADKESVPLFLQYWKNQGYDFRMLPSYVTGENEGTNRALAANGLPPDDGEGEVELTIESKTGADVIGEHWQIAKRESSVVKEEVFARLEEGEWINTILFTSFQEVDTLNQHLKGGLARWCVDKTVVAAGKDTADALQAQNINIDRQTDGTSTEELISVLMARTLQTT
ncbi:uroporphyrinogen III methyltransferase/synthase [Geomicrobium halophilum]|uniref:Uroporphyrinogen-III C-methyltransferase n=1 Tax=Geomicrobium halophilum TaxID=549000 RepID=A0A841Q007_9BACL|nr:uroporphyrinogen-III C-methyltransferase [Geomicrobium halophilum]MBB6448518.1 uroporphyrinogen III methyltransferase/synthase [Geomicrobium halophilum]